MIARKNHQTCTRAAFTLMEMLVVVAIIVVLAGIGGYYLLPRVDEAKESTAKAQLKTLTKACETYKLNEDDWPPSLESLSQQSPKGHLPLLEPDALRDPWGQPYGYDPSGTHNSGMRPDIWVNRPNHQIGNWPGGTTH
jgi:general secretion pathway protein G